RSSGKEGAMVKVIKTDDDYRKALVEIDILMASDPALGTPDGDTLELLAFLVSKYEEDHFPFDKPDPVEAIKFRMDQMGLTKRDMIPYMGSRSKVSEVLSGKRPLTLKMIRAIHKHLGIPAESLIEEPSHDPGSELDPSKFPLAEMAKRRWFPGFHGTLKEAKAKGETLLGIFFKEAQLQDALCRQNVRIGSKMDRNALLAWTARVSILARQNPLPVKYRDEMASKEFFHDLSKISSFKEGPLLAKEFLNKRGIHMVILRHLQKTHLDGAVMRLHDGTPVIAMTLRYDRIDNFWFTLFHELAHLHLHLKHDTQDCFIDDLDATGDRREELADKFARDALIPQEKLKDLLTISAPADALTFAYQLNVHPAIIAGRLRWERKDYRIYNRLIGSGEVRKFFSEEFYH
ncbi:MAG TPA: ImmA/IrrE family metallo-endopeptidase, partial [Deltaproteobacteria bacterium]|nr:ImmA/IrrE family metallo-endopeptidase [Deltaproteobacteria bacterium]